MDINRVSLFDFNDELKEPFQRYFVSNTYYVEATEEPSLEDVQYFLSWVVKPDTVSPYQGKTALMHIGLYDTVDNMISTSNNAMLKIAWTSAIEFNKNSPLIQTMASQLNLSKEQVDVLFLCASYIK